MMSEISGGILDVCDSLLMTHRVVMLKLGECVGGVRQRGHGLVAVDARCGGDASERQHNQY
jgi:hypothetical protein